MDESDSLNLSICPICILKKCINLSEYGVSNDVHIIELKSNSKEDQSLLFIEVTNIPWPSFSSREPETEIYATFSQLSSHLNPPSVHSELMLDLIIS